jgi:hypothetical protein
MVSSNVLSQNFPARVEDNKKKTSVRTAGLRAKIRTQDISQFICTLRMFRWLVLQLAPVPSFPVKFTETCTD